MTAKAKELQTEMANQAANRNVDVRQQLADLKEKLSVGQMERTQQQILLYQSQGNLADTKVLTEQLNQAKTREEVDNIIKAHGLTGEARNAALLSADPQQNSILHSMWDIEKTKLAGKYAPNPSTGSVHPITPTEGINTKTNQIVPLGAGGMGAGKQAMPANPFPAGPQATPSPNGGVQFTPQTPGVLPGKLPATSNAKPVASFVKPPTQSWDSPEDAYGTGPKLPVTRPLPGTPAGHTPQNDAVLSMPVGVMNAGEIRQVKAAKDLYQGGKNFAALVAQIPDNELGTIKGNLNKLLVGSMTPGDLGLTANSKTSQILAYLRSEAAAIAVSHLGAQTMRSYLGAEAIQKEILAWGSDKNTILGAVKGYIDQAEKTFKDVPQSKATVAQLPGMNYQEMQRLYHGVPKDTTTPEPKRRTAKDYNSPKP